MLLHILVRGEREAPNGLMKALGSDYGTKKGMTMPP